MQQHHFSLRARRSVAAIACTVLVGLGISTATASTAVAADPPDLTVSWHDQALTADVNGNGRPDLGDQVTLSADFTAGVRGTTVFHIGDGLRLQWLPDLYVPAGSTVTASHTVTVTQFHLTGAGGSGPTFEDIDVSHWRNRTLLPVTLTVAPPAVLHIAPEPLAIATTLDLVENGGAVDGIVREGDTVGYHTTVTNTTGKIMTIGSITAASLPGYDDFPGTASLDPGESLTFTRNPVTVTYADMVAGSIAFPNVDIAWSARYDALIAETFWGNNTAVIGSVTTEGVDASFDSSVTFKVRSQLDGSHLGLGQAVEGDVIDLKVDATNNGNVTLNYVGINRDAAWGLASGLTSQDNSQLAPGTSMPNGVWKAKDLKSGGNGVLAPYT
jgi:hypothetical protein